AQLRAGLRPRAWPWPSAAVLVAAAAGAVAVLAAMGWTRGRAQAGAFFGAGALLLVAALALAHLALAVRARLGAARRLTLAGLALRNLTRRRGRSMATIAIVACGVFLVAAIGANYKSPPEDAGVAASGTGGFRLFGETALAIHEDLLGRDGLKAYALPADLPSRVRAIVPMRVHEGDDASCLNLNRVQQPRLAGVRPEALARRGAFTFTETVPSAPGENPWLLLARREGPDVVPCIGDAATIQWSLGKAVGEEVPYTDERGRAFRLRIVGAVAGSILQGMLVIGEDAFIERFPGDSGYRMLLVDTPADQAEAVAAVLSDRLADVGLAVTPTAQRLADFGAMQNTYLVIFQTLGGLGLVLGSLGLGVVVLRNVLERRGELALMRAVGFRRRAIAWMVLGEHWDLLAGGLVCGLVPAWLAVMPVLAGGGAAMPYGLVGLTLAAVAASGMLWTWLATRVALRGPLLEALRNE
ncbi:MAG: FtsX-like permease family protein, partial [Planctomycetes bacterium]|nr:FtsX-like permease family protein [Planctomycetota bacterium]